MNDTATTRMLLTTAVLAAVAALMTAPAHAYFADSGGGGSSSASAVPTPTGTGLDAGPIPYLSHGIGVDQTLFAGQSTDGVDESRVAFDSARVYPTVEDTQSSSASGLDSGPIPYLSHGIGVDETLFAGQSTDGVDESRVAFDSARVYPTVDEAGSSSGSGIDWTWTGLGAGLAALLAAGMTALYITARPRGGRVALP